MNTQYFKYAVEVERTGSITKAAENLFMAQPNLSKAIKELEDSLKISIFERTPKGMVCTSRGKEFLIYAKNILDQIEKMENLYEDETPNGQKFSISIPRISYIANSIVSFIKDFDFSREIDVKLNETSTMNIISDVLESRSRIGIIRFRSMYEKYFTEYLSEKEISYEQLAELPRVAILSEKNPLVLLNDVSISNLSSFTEVAYGDTVIPHLPTLHSRKATKNHSVKKKIFVTDRISQLELLSNLRTSYSWTSPIPNDTLKKYGLTQVICEDENTTYKDLLIYKRDYKLSAMDKKFLEQLDVEKENLAI